MALWPQLSWPLYIFISQHLATPRNSICTWLCLDDEGKDSSHGAVLGWIWAGSIPSLPESDRSDWHQCPTAFRKECLCFSQVMVCPARPTAFSGSQTLQSSMPTWSCPELCGLSRLHSSSSVVRSRFQQVSEENRGSRYTCLVQVYQSSHCSFIAWPPCLLSKEQA